MSNYTIKEREYEQALTDIAAELDDPCVEVVTLRGPYTQPIALGVNVRAGGCMTPEEAAELAGKVARAAAIAATHPINGARIR